MTRWSWAGTGRAPNRGGMLGVALAFFIVLCGIWMAVAAPAPAPDPGKAEVGPDVIQRALIQLHSATDALRETDYGRTWKHLQGARVILEETAGLPAEN